MEAFSNKLSTLNTREELIDFFQKLSSKTEFFFRGVKIELFSVIETIVFEWLLKKLELARPHGQYLRIVFPESLAADLLMVSANPQNGAKNTVQKTFFINAADKAAIEELLNKNTLQVLMDLNSRYAFKMLDQFFEFGPLSDNSEQTADDLIRIIDALSVTSSNTDGNDDLTNPSPTDEPLEVIITTADTTKANLAKLALEADGIPCVLFHTAQSGVWGGLNTSLGVQIAVPASKKNKAVELIAQYSSSSVTASNDE